ncbi:hypothetical protein ACFL59_15310 [Planctomycetota bacterium]
MKPVRTLLLAVALAGTAGVPCVYAEDGAKEEQAKETPRYILGVSGMV